MTWPLLACGSQPASPPAPPPTVVLEPGASGPVLARAMDPTAARSCTVRLHVGLVTGPSAGCQFVDTPSKQRGALHYACGDGDATATIGNLTFDGRVEHERVHLEARREFDWGDGCHWQNVQVIEGSLSGSVLEYSYREQPLTGDHCAPSCLGGSPVGLEP